MSNNVSKREETMAKREEARAIVRFRALDFDRYPTPPEAGTYCKLYAVKQGPFLLGHVVRYPTGNFGFELDERLHVSMYAEREMPRTPWNRYNEMFRCQPHEHAPIGDRVFDTEDAVRESIWTFRDILFAWCLDDVIDRDRDHDRMPTSADDDETAGMKE